MDDLANEPPTGINPYEVLQLETTASPQEVKSAYKKLALQNHPDKVAESSRDTAHFKFQEIAFAYAILSEPRRRQRYDTTGNTSESITDEDGFDWTSFYKARFADSVTGEKLHNFKESYQHSEEEKRDVLAAYTAAKGDMDKVFDQVMLSNALHDEVRFGTMIENGVDAGEVESFEKFHKEPESRKLKRQKRAAQESTEAMEYAKELGVYDALFPSKAASTQRQEDGHSEPKGKSKKKQQKKQEDDESALAALIQKKNRQAKADAFLDDLEARYAPSGKKSSKKRKMEEPPEELFQKNHQKKSKQPQVQAQAADEEDEGEEEVDDIGTDDSESDPNEEDEAEGEEIENRPSKTRSKNSKSRKGDRTQSAKINGAKKAATKDTSSRRAPGRKAAARKG